MQKQLTSPEATHFIKFLAILDKSISVNAAVSSTVYLWAYKIDL